MKIRHLVLTPSFAGVERHVCVLANAQIAQGHDVEVWGGRPSAMRELLSGSVRYRPARHVLKAAVAGLASPAPDILHAHMTKAEAAALPPRALRGIPLVATRHFAARRGLTRGGRLARPPISRLLDAQIAISRFVAEAIDGPATVVYPGVETHDTGHDGSRAPVVLVVQRLQAEKLTPMALRIFAAGAPPDWRLEVVGQGPELAELQDLARGLDIAGRTHFLGFRSDVPRLMRGSSLLLAPCEIEGLGLGVLEAMAHGLPVLASDAGAHPETVGLATDAQLYRPGDVDMAAGLLRMLCGDEDLRGRYGRQLVEIQRRTFSPQAQAVGTEAVYRKVLDD